MEQQKLNFWMHDLLNFIIALEFDYAYKFYQNKGLFLANQCLLSILTPPWTFVLGFIGDEI